MTVYFGKKNVLQAYLFLSLIIELPAIDSNPNQCSTWFRFKILAKVIVRSVKRKHWSVKREERGKRTEMGGEPTFWHGSV